MFSHLIFRFSRFSIQIDSFDNALAYCLKFRPNQPPDYNPLRQFFQPIPSLDPEPQALATGTVNPHEQTNNGTDEQNEQDSTSEHTYSERFGDEGEHSGLDNNFDGNITQNNGQQIENPEANEENNDAFISDNSIDAPQQMVNTISFEANLEGDNDLIDEPQLDESDVMDNQIEHDNDHESVDETVSKFGLPQVDINDDDVAAMSHLFDENSQVTNGNTNDEASGVLATIQLEPNEKAEFRGGKIIVTKVIDDETVMTYAYGEKPIVFPPLYQIKMNDALSQNIPFKENVCINVKNSL